MWRNASGNSAEAKSIFLVSVWLWSQLISSASQKKWSWYDQLCWSHSLILWMLSSYTATSINSPKMGMNPKKCSKKDSVWMSHMARILVNTYAIKLIFTAFSHTHTLPSVSTKEGHRWWVHVQELHKWKETKWASGLKKLYNMRFPVSMETKQESISLNTKKVFL